MPSPTHNATETSGPIAAKERTIGENAADDACTDASPRFRERLVDAMPHLRAFAYSLCGRMDLADDLVQETMVKAWSARHRFRPGTSIRAWTFVILRNSYISLMRRSKFTASYDPEMAERTLAAPPAQEAPIHLQDAHRALQSIGRDKREALVLVGAGGFSYDEAAAIAGCATGTMKSRVSRARAALQARLKRQGSLGRPISRKGAKRIGNRPDADRVLLTILGDLDRLSGRQHAQA